MLASDPPRLEETLADAHVRHFRDSGAILAHQSLLQDFAAKTGQLASMQGLQFKLEHDFARRKVPHLLCIVAGQDASSPLTLESLLGCVLLFEYRLASWSTGLFATGDSTGLGTVVAPVQIRAQIAALASCSVLREGQLVLVCFRSQPGDAANVHAVVFPPQQQGFWTWDIREANDTLPLRPTLDDTLDTLGKRTRTHLRYYRRRLQEQTGCVFVADAASQISAVQLGPLNSTSLEPVRQAIFDRQFHATARLPGGYVCGLRAADGRWLCLAGGWRQGGKSLIEWQMNAAGIKNLSLSTAFRAFLIEHEVSLGTEQLCFHGGTKHSISHAFLKESAVDFMLRRPGLWPSLLVQLIAYFAQGDAAFANRGNFLIDALRRRDIQWTPLSQTGRLAPSDAASTPIV